MARLQLSLGVRWTIYVALVPGFAINSRALFHIAREACVRAPAAPAQSIVAIAFAVIALESFVNEIVESLNFPSPSDDSVEVRDAARDGHGV